MSNAMYINYMTRAYGNFLKNFETKSKNSGKTDETFVDKVMQKSEESSVVSEAQKTEAVSAKDMTMEEYKQYISDKISQIPMNFSRMQDSIAIHISEEGFEAMKNDPEYEEWVLGYLQKDFMCYNPWASTCGGCYCVMYISATKEEYHGESWSAGYQNGNGSRLYRQKSEDSFWESRMKRKKRLEEQNKKLYEKKAFDKRLRDREYYEELLNNRAVKQDLDNDKFIFQGGKNYGDYRSRSLRKYV